jgi:AcrR family transcriptional regulator
MSKIRRPASTVKRSSSSPWKNREDRVLELEDKRFAVLTTAAELFVTQGFHSTKLSDVADRLNITKPAIYYYFESKDEILVECTRAALAASEEYFAKEDDATLSGRDRLERFMIWFAVNMTTPFGQCLVRVADQDVEAETQKHLTTAKRAIDRRFRQLVEAGIADRSIKQCDAKIAAFTVAGALSWLSHWHRPGGRWSARQAAELVTELLLDGLALQARKA